MIIAASVLSPVSARLVGREDAQRREPRQVMDDLFADAAAEIVEVALDAVVGERQHRDGVAADQRGRHRSLDQHRRVALLEDRRVAALRQLDHRLVGASFFAVVAHQFGPQPPRLHADDRVGARIEGLFLAEHLHADDVFLQLVPAAGDGFERR